MLSGYVKYFRFCLYYLIDMLCPTALNSPVVYHWQFPNIVLPTPLFYVIFYATHLLIVIQLIAR